MVHPPLGPLQLLVPRSVAKLSKRPQAIAGRISSRYSHNSTEMNFTRSQRTIRRPVAVLGFGYHTGKDVRVEFRPAPMGSGITFVREDLGLNARIPARVENRIEVPRRTCLQVGNARVEMVEHVLAALAGMEVDNCEIRVDAAEMPGCDGSAMAFVAAIESVGRTAQEARVKRLEIAEHVVVESDDSRIEAFPVDDESYSIEYTLDYTNDSVIGNQVADLEITPRSFLNEIAPCRTFLLQREADQLAETGLGRRVRTQDLLIFDEHGPVNNRLRFENECARHKALDVIGDLALTGCELVGRIVAYKSGHRLNSMLAQELMSRFAGRHLRISA
jgi:UDP-3-O-acyl N-acetylglucosamine deacetylase